jgi:exopolysaccharide biosynthesis polyprenyl glycosylphosphotransferase
MTTPNLAIQNVKPAPSALIHASALDSPRFRRVWAPKIRLLTDFLTTAVAMWAAVRLLPPADFERGVAQLQYRPIVIPIAALGTALIFRYTGMYARAATPLNISVTEALLRGVGFSFLLLMVAAHNAGFAGKRAALCAASAIGLLLLQRYASRYVTRWLGRHGVGDRHTLGNGDPNDFQHANKLSSYPSPTVERESRISDRSRFSAEPNRQPRSSVNAWGNEERVTLARDSGEIVDTHPCAPGGRLDSTMQALAELNLGLSPLFDSGALPCSRSHYDIAGVPLFVDLRTPTSGRTRTVVKRMADLVLCIPGLALSLPVFLVTSIAIKLDSDGPVFFCQNRIGKNGQVFRLWKFRSMREDAPQYERSPLSDADPRLTRVGRVIRRISIDELPQLINVLSGEMSLVGPRPEMPFIVDQYGPFEHRRLLVRPGITGLWQISPARALPIHHNMEYDLYYIDQQNIFLDAAILLRTVTAVVRGIGAA